MCLLTLEVGRAVSVLSALGTLFFPLVCPDQLLYEVFCLSLLYLVSSCSVVTPGKPTLILKGNKGRLDLGESESKGKIRRSEWRGN